MPRHGVVARTDLDPGLVEALVAVLTALDTSDEGRAVLEAFDETARFDRLTPEDFSPVVTLREALDDALA